MVFNKFFAFMALGFKVKNEFMGFALGFKRI